MRGARRWGRRGRRGETGESERWEFRAGEQTRGVTSETSNKIKTAPQDADQSQGGGHTHTHRLS